VDLGLQGCVAIVGGASSGMGRACAVALAREGCNVAVFARRRELLDEAAAEIEALGSGAQALAVAGDSAVPADLEALVARTLELRAAQLEEARYLEHAVELLGLEAHIDAIGISEELGHAKPAPESYRAALELIDADPAEIGDLCAFLCSTNAAYLNGITILMDGGLAKGLLS